MTSHRLMGITCPISLPRMLFRTLFSVPQAEPV